MRERRTSQGEARVAASVLGSQDGLSRSHHTGRTEGRQRLRGEAAGWGPGQARLLDVDEACRTARCCAGYDAGRSPSRVANCPWPVYGGLHHEPNELNPLPTTS